MADRRTFSQALPNAVLVRLGGRASQPTGNEAGSCSSLASQTFTGIVISTRYRLSGMPPAFRWTMVSRQASARLEAA